MGNQDRAVEAVTDLLAAITGDPGGGMYLSERQEIVDAAFAAVGITFDAEGNIDAPFFVPQWVDTGPALMLGIPEDVPIDTTATYLLIRKADD